MIHATDVLNRTLERYWSIFEVRADAVASIVADVFTSDAQFESDTLPEPLIGHQAITDHVHAIRSKLQTATTRHVTEVEWVHHTARWCWAWNNATGSRRGMDIARVAPDGEHIELLVVFTGLLPPPT